jgi:hypothetical protein
MSYFSDLLRDVLAAAGRGELPIFDVAALQELLLPYITAGSVLGATDGLLPLVRIGYQFESSGINAAAMRWARDYVASAYDSGLGESLTATHREFIREQVSRYFGTDDMTLDSLRDNIARVVDADRAELVAVTEIVNAQAGGAEASWLEANRQYGAEIITGKRWNSANDSRVCPVCAPLGGMFMADDTAQSATVDEQLERAQRADLGGDFVHPGGSGAADEFAGRAYRQPPAHPRCRCFVTPEVR